MNYVVLDLEWNQCPSGKEEECPELPFEIIEIGAVMLDQKRRVLSEFKEVICPQVYRRLHYKTNEILHYKQEELLTGRSFPEVFGDFMAWCKPPVRFCTWGSLDLMELQRNMDYYGIENPLPRPLFFFDIQKFFSLLYSDGKTRISLEGAVEFMRIEKTREFHRAVDDAWYTAVLMQRMNLDLVKPYASVDYYRPPKTREEEIYMVFPNYSKYVSRTFPDKETALKDKTVTSTRCYQCGRLLRKKIQWFPAGQKAYLSLCVCPAHGYLKGKLRIKKSKLGEVFAVKTLKLVDEEQIKTIYDKQTALRLHRMQRRKMKKQENK